MNSTEYKIRYFTIRSPDFTAFGEIDENDYIIHITSNVAILEKDYWNYLKLKDFCEKEGLEFKIIEL